MIRQQKEELPRGGLVFILWTAHHSEAADGVRGNTLLYLLQVLLMKSNFIASSALAKFSIFRISTLLSSLTITVLHDKSTS